VTQNISVPKVMHVEGNRVVRGDEAHNALNSGEFLDNVVSEEGI
jgi:Asp-tRNA(Asn)/Glu-tRNA(Gln) amidotransferase C subunit